MAEQSILFKGPMVRAILEGRKTMTRRILKPQPNMLNGGKPLNNGYGAYSTERGWKKIPYAVGDQLWVRETHILEPYSRLEAGGDLPGQEGDQTKPYALYRANYDEAILGPGWRPSIHMPRWASRINLRATKVKLERLQEISEEDALAEGVIFNSEQPSDIHRHCIPLGNGEVISDWSARDCFRQLWHSIHRPGAWAANPWVAAYTFELVKS